MSDPAIIEAAARALRKEALLFEFPESCTEIAKAVLTAVTPLIRAAALEEAAQMAEDRAEWGKGMLENSRIGAVHQGACNEIAIAIRSLKEQP